MNTVKPSSGGLLSGIVNRTDEENEALKYLRMHLDALDGLVQLNGQCI